MLIQILRRRKIIPAPTKSVMGANPHHPDPLKYVLINKPYTAWPAKNMVHHVGTRPMNKGPITSRSVAPSVATLKTPWMCICMKIQPVITSPLCSPVSYCFHYFRQQNRKNVVSSTQVNRLLQSEVIKTCRKFLPYFYNFSKRKWAFICVSIHYCYITKWN